MGAGHMQESNTVPGFTVRRYAAEDYPFLCAMLVTAACWREETPSRSLEELLAAKPRLRRYIEQWGRAGDAALVAVAGGRPVGAVWYRLFPEEEPGYGFVSASIPEVSVGVVPDGRRQGVGGALLAALIGRTMRDGRAALSLSVSKSNPARHLYEKHGFVQVRDDGDAWVMCRRLTPIIADTPRLRLRHFVPEDVQAFAPILADPDVMRFSASGPKTVEQTRQLVDGCRRDYGKDGFSLYAVVHAEDARLIGYCGLWPQTVNGVQEVEISYRLNPDYWGRGLATEAARAVVAHAAGRLGLKRLVAVIEAANVGSVRVAERAGLHWESDTEWRGLSVGVYAAAL